MGWALRKERAAAVDGRPVLVPASEDRPEHVRFTLDGVSWREAADRWRWRAHTDWNTLALSGHGVRLAVEEDRLKVTHGHTSTAGRQADRMLYRGQHGVQAIVLLASSGSITLDSLQWCRDQHICLLVLDRDGRLVTVMTPPGPQNIQLRIAQYQVDALPIAKCLVAWKLRECALVRPSVAGTMDAGRNSCDRCPTLDWVRTVEAEAARAYWASWSMGLWWKDKDVPPHWRTFDQRESPLSRSGRHATTPVNAMLNYSYSVLAGRIERAVVSRGIDPAMGHLHAPKDGRASLVYDLIEPLRPMVDTQLLTWIAGERWRMSDFVVDRSGVVRLHPELARVVVQTGTIDEDAIGAVLDWYIGQLRALTEPVREKSTKRRTARHGRGLGRGRQAMLLGER
jgi:CRISPR-associated protein Cas1